ncbi:hypothetical protein V6N13_039675 [Hibiscus sabdariffa]
MKKNGNKKGGDGEKKENGSSIFVFKVDCLCDGCAIKVLKCIRGFQGVDAVTTESSSNKVTVTGAVDPAAIKEKLVKKTKKKVDLISPQQKKDGNKEENKEKKADKEKNQDSGVHELKVDKVKELVTVKGTMDVKALAEALKDKLKKNVEIVPLKKEKEGKKEGGENGGGGGGDGGGGKKKNKGSNGGAGDGGNETAAPATGGGKMEGNRMEFVVQPQFGYMPSYPGYGHPGYGYGYGHQQAHGHGYPGYVPGYPVSVHPPHHLFNDENPNACAIM